MSLTCGSMVASYTRGGWVAGVRVFLLNDKHLTKTLISTGIFYRGIQQIIHKGFRQWLNKISKLETEHC